VKSKNFIKLVFAIVLSENQDCTGHILHVHYGSHGLDNHVSRWRHLDQILLLASCQLSPFPINAYPYIEFLKCFTTIFTHLLKKCLVSPYIILLAKSGGNCGQIYCKNDKFHCFWVDATSSQVDCQIRFFQDVLIYGINFFAYWGELNNAIRISEFQYVLNQYFVNSQSATSLSPVSSVDKDKIFSICPICAFNFVFVYSTAASKICKGAFFSWKTTENPKKIGYEHIFIFICSIFNWRFYKPMLILSSPGERSSSCACTLNRM